MPRPRRRRQCPGSSAAPSTCWFAAGPWTSRSGRKASGSPMARAKEKIATTASAAAAPLAGRRLLLVGPALAQSAAAALKNAATESAGLDRLATARAGAYDLVL